VKNSPPYNVAKPVSHPYEVDLYKYYGWLPYWENVGGKEKSHTPSDKGESEKPVSKVTRDTHLRSSDEVIGYHIQALDGQIGHVEDFIVDDENWIIRYLVIDTKDILPGKNVLISPLWVD